MIFPDAGHAYMTDAAQAANQEVLHFLAGIRGNLGQRRPAAGGGGGAFSDCDPAGWQMPVSIARKRQAFSVLDEGMASFQAVRTVLTPDQAGKLDLPSTPLKESEVRADRWTAATGREQTEVDALVTLRAAEFRQIAAGVLDPYYDHTLDQRVRKARSPVAGAGLAAVEDGLAGASAASTTTSTAGWIASACWTSASPEVGGLPPTCGTVLLDSEWDFAEQCRELWGKQVYGAEELASQRSESLGFLPHPWGSLLRSTAARSGSPCFRTSPGLPGRRRVPGRRPGPPAGHYEAGLDSSPPLSCSRPDAAAPACSPTPTGPSSSG